MADVDPPPHRGIARTNWAGQPGALRVLVPQLSRTAAWQVRRR